MRGAQCCICQRIYLLVRYSKVLPIQRVSDEFGYSQLTPPPIPPQIFAAELVQKQSVNWFSCALPASNACL